jgi:hypothetical protein
MRRPEEEIASLLAELPPAPEAWVAAARELPRTRRELADVIGRIEADEEFRGRVLADIEVALGPASDRRGSEQAAVDGQRAARIAALRARLDLPL